MDRFLRGMRSTRKNARYDDERLERKLQLATRDTRDFRLVRGVRVRAFT
jgi:hypothetical protein